MSTAIRVIVVGGEAGDHAVLRSVIAAPDFALAVIEPAQLGTTAATVVATLLAARPDAIVVDAKQPGATGHHLCRLLRGVPALDGVPLLMMGSLDAVDAHRAAYAAGCDEYLEKPISRSHLGFRLRAMARLRRAWDRERPTARVLAALTSLVRVQHPARVSIRSQLTEWCVGFSRHLGLASDDCAALAHAAALHDLGESDVPHDLVIGVAPMSHDDHATLFRHTEIGASVVEALDGTGALTTILRSHHERWDGQGYPNGLHREQIPRLARIFRVLDVSHTVTCARAAHAAPLIASSAGRAATDRSGLDPALASAFRAWVALAA
ncbi:MAG: HD domain-containing protein [Myxococcales bacterium]|nr:HD domain-containing protein [Myxococcales bacterium]